MRWTIHTCARWAITKKPRREIPGRGCSSNRCPRWDSNPHCADFEAASSTNWDTGAYLNLEQYTTQSGLIPTPCCQHLSQHPIQYPIQRLIRHPNHSHHSPQPTAAPFPHQPPIPHPIEPPSTATLPPRHHTPQNTIAGFGTNSVKCRFDSLSISCISAGLNVISATGFKSWSL